MKYYRYTISQMSGKIEFITKILQKKKTVLEIPNKINKPKYKKD